MTDSYNSAISSNKRPSARLAAALAGFATLAGVILVVVHLSDIAKFGELAAQSKPSWLLLAAAVQVTTYLCVAIVWRMILLKLGHPLALRALFPLSVAKLFADQALPSGGLSGAAFFLYALGRRGVDPASAFSAFAFATIAFFVAFLTAAAISLMALASAETAPPKLAESVALFSGIIIAIALITALFFVYKPRNTPRWIKNFPGGKRLTDLIGVAAKEIGARPGLFASAAAIQFGVRCIDGLTLFIIFYAIGAPAPYWVCFFAVVLASVAATIGPIPMGLGAFEGGMIATLSVFSVSLESALAVTLVYRGLSLWAPLIPGFVLIQREFLHRLGDIDADQGQINRDEVDSQNP